MRKLILEDGTEYLVEGFGSDSEKMLELVFNTSMVGYQEIISDPSYTDQAVVMTYPIIGNYGITPEDFETEKPTIGAMIVKDYVDEPSNFRCNETLSECMKKYDIVGISGAETREITRKIREIGSCKVLITDESTSKEEGMKRLAAWDYATDQVKRVSAKKISEFENKDGDVIAKFTTKFDGSAAEGKGEASANCNAEAGAKKLHVVLIDCGAKLNIARSLTNLGLKVTMVPYDVKLQEVIDLKPDGIMISNGPGNPEDAKETIELIKELHGKYPIMGICLGHQILALSYGAKTYKLKFGHRGGNHPVKNLLTDKIEITSQNHSYAVDEASAVEKGLEITHINILDNTVEGLRCKKDRAFSVQYHPESAPGPEDSKYLFSTFLKMMKGEQVDA